MPPTPVTALALAPAEKPPSPPNPMNKIHDSFFLSLLPQAPSPSTLRFFAHKKTVNHLHLLPCNVHLASSSHHMVKNMQMRNSE